MYMTWKYHDFLCKAAEFSESKTCLSIGLTYYSRKSVDFKLNHRWIFVFQRLYMFHLHGSLWK